MKNGIRFCFTFSCLLVCLDMRAQVTISSPEKGTTVSSPVFLSAALIGTQMGTIMVYDNNALILKKVGTSSISTTLALPAGLHTILVKATEAANQSYSASTTVTVVPPELTGLNSVEAEIAADMTGKNEGFPLGVPLSYAWANGPVVEMGNNPGTWKALTAWGVVYPASPGNPATNSRVNIRNVQTYVLQKSNGKWLLLQNTSTPAGAAYLADFTTTVNVPGDMRHESDGTISVTAVAGSNFHFYPTVRASVVPSDIGGIITTFQARLITGNPALPDDRATAAYLAGSGGDYYPALTGSWPGSLPYNPGIAIGKEKYVKTYWRAFSMTTMSAAQLRLNPPPIDFSGVSP